MDALGIEQGVMGGHSYGGLLTYCMAAHQADWVAKCVVMDAPAEVHPKILEQVRPSLDRLGMTFPPWRAYLDHAKAMPWLRACGMTPSTSFTVTTFLVGDSANRTWSTRSTPLFNQREH